MKGCVIRMYLINRIAINVSSLKSVDFYKALGFEEESRNQKENELIVSLKGCLTVLELHVISNLNKLANNSYGLRSIVLRSEKLENNYQEDEEGKYQILHDPDGLEIIIREIPCQYPTGDWNFSE